MTILNVFLITTIVCFIVDLSGIVDTIKSLIAKILSRKTQLDIPSEAIVISPFDCSLCMSWWINIFYLIFVNEFTLFNILVVAIFSWFSSNISGFLNWIKEMLTYLENKMYKWIS